MNVGLCGAHRTGKTTLAMELAKLTNRQFIKTRTSEVFKECGVDPARPMDFATRMRMQIRFLEAYERDWRNAGGPFVTDRTPVDLMAYTLADIQGATVVDYPEFQDYIEQCFEVTNQFFDTLVIVQPGIPLAEAEWKAALNEAYIEHINSLVIGLCHDERLDCRLLRLSRGSVVLKERLTTIAAAL